MAPSTAVPATFTRAVDTLRSTRPRPEIVLVLTWDIADEVISQLEADGGGWGATYLVPLPEPHEVVG